LIESEKNKMKDLGILQKRVWESIRNSTAESDASALGLLGQIASEMDKKHDEWTDRLRTEPKPDADLSRTFFRQIPVPQSLRPLARQAPDNATIQDFTGKSIRSATLFGQQLLVGNYKELLIAVAEYLSEKSADFDERAVKVRGNNPYFSERPDELRIPYKLRRSTLHMETNLNANLIVEICWRLLEELGHQPSDLKLDITPHRVRAIKGSKG
jgi:hypothetical protein